jgi:hypothetical protein
MANTACLWAAGGDEGEGGLLDSEENIQISARQRIQLMQVRLRGWYYFGTYTK